MKGKYLLVCVTLPVVYFLSACSYLTSVVTPTSMPTIVVDPCVSANIPTLLEPIDDLLYAFDDITFVANFTPQVQLTQPIMKLQSSRRALDALKGPICLDELIKASHDYMNSVILYLSYFMGGVEKETIDAALLTSQELRVMLDSEYQKLAGFSIPSSPSIQPSSFEINQTPEIAVTGMVETIEVKNAGNQGVNIRKDADINSSIIGSLTAGETIIGYGKDVTGRWIMVKTNSTYGWVNVEMVELNYVLEEIPIISETPSP